MVRTASRSPPDRQSIPQASTSSWYPVLRSPVTGCRLGQGGGFYDRFLPLVRDDCVTCGVCFREQLLDDLPVERHDRLLTLVITDASTGPAETG